MALMHTPEFVDVIRRLNEENWQGFFPDQEAEFLEQFGLAAGLLDVYRELVKKADAVQNHEQAKALEQEIDTMPPFFKDQWCVRVIRQNPSVIEATRTGNELKIRVADRIPHLRDRRYLMIEIDLYATRAEIMEKAEMLVRHYQALASRRTRRSEFQVDKWLVFRLHKNEGLDLRAIANQLEDEFPIEEPPDLKGDDLEDYLFNHSDALRQAIHRAIQAAEEILRVRPPHSPR